MTHRRLWQLLVLVLLVAFPLAVRSAQASHRRVGMFLIHGKGGKDLQVPEVAWDYWGYDMINTITEQQTIPYAVGYYDGTRNPYSSALRISAQIADFIQSRGIDDLVVVTHSFGATVFRIIASRPDQYIYTPLLNDPPLEQWRYDSANQRHLIIDRLRVAWLIAGPNGGSEAADFLRVNRTFGRTLIDYAALLLGQYNNATAYCTTWRMGVANSSSLFGTPGRPPLPGIWHPIVGLDPFTDGRHLEDYVLQGLSIFLPIPNDGMVASWSASLVGRPFYFGNCGGSCSPMYFANTLANHHHSRRYESRFDYIDRRIAELIGYVTATRRLR